MISLLCDDGGMHGRLPATKIPGLRHWREAADLNARELADLVGLSSSMVSQLESGKKGASHSTLLRLAKVLGCTIDQLGQTRGQKNYPKPLSDFLATLAPDDIKSEEIEALLAVKIPGYRLTARAYGNLFDAIQNSEKMHS